MFLLGLILGASPYLENLRIFGVLQRFAICYFVVATIYITIAFRNGLKPEMQNTVSILTNGIIRHTVLKKIKDEATILKVPLRDLERNEGPRGRYIEKRQLNVFSVLIIYNDYLIDVLLLS